MNKRPKLQLELTQTDKILEIISCVVLVMTWILVVVYYTKLPDIIPIHYNASGKVDGFGAKTNILTPPIIATIIYIGLTILNRFPYVFNYPKKITEENAVYQYTNATRMVRCLKFGIIVLFAMIVLETILIANTRAVGFGIWFLPLTLVFVLIPLIYYLVKAFRY